MKTLLLALALLATAGGAVAGIASGHPSNSMRDEYTTEELVDSELIKKCLESGDDAAYTKAKYARQRLTQCGTSLLHTDRLLPELRTALISGGRGVAPIVKKVCKTYQASGQQCLDQYLGDLAPCLDEAQEALERLVVRMAETSWDYACQKDALRAQLFFKNATLSCVEQTSPGLLQCVAPYLSMMRAAGDPTRVVATLLANKECGLFLTMSKCVVGELRKCDDSTAAQLVEGSFNATLRISPCAGAQTLEAQQQQQQQQQQQDEEALNGDSGAMQSLQDSQSLEMVLINRVQELVRGLEADRQRAHSARVDATAELKVVIEAHAEAMRRLGLAVDVITGADRHRRT